MCRILTMRRLPNPAEKSDRILSGLVQMEVWLWLYLAFSLCLGCFVLTKCAIPTYLTGVNVKGGSHMFSSFLYYPKFSINHRTYNILLFVDFTH